LTILPARPSTVPFELANTHTRTRVIALHTQGVYTLHDLRAFGRKKGWCPYFLARHMMAFSNVIVYNYQYMLDPKVSQV
jgi:DNA excision repair protein ERCC-2